MMQSGIMRLSEGGTPVGMTPQMAADFISWFKGKFGRGRLGPDSWNSTKMLWLRDSGYKTYGNSLKEYYPGDWDSYVNWVTGGGANDTDTDTDTEGPQTVFEAGSDLPSIMDYENGAIITVGDIKYILTNNIWKEYEEPGGGTSGDYGTDASGNPLPDPNDSKYGEGAVYGVGDDLYEVINGKWEKVGGQSSDGSNQGGMFGLGIGPFLSDLFGVTGTGVGNVLSGIFGQGGNISDLIELFLKGKAVKGAWDAIEYEVPTGQKESMSDFEKANPLTTNMTLAGIRPNYLQNQKYAIPVGQSGIPAATHTVGTPFVEKVEEVQGGEMGGIMGAKGHGDIVPALLEPNEFVFTRKAVQNMGNGNVNLGAKRMYKIMKDLERMG